MDELKYINNSLENKKENHPKYIYYNRSYLFASKDKDVALPYIKIKKLDNNK